MQIKSPCFLLDDWPLVRCGSELANGRRSGGCTFDFGTTIEPNVSSALHTHSFVDSAVIIRALGVRSIARRYVTTKSLRLPRAKAQRRSSRGCIACRRTPSQQRGVCCVARFRRSVGAVHGHCPSGTGLTGTGLTGTGLSGARCRSGRLALPNLLHKSRVPDSTQ